MIVDTAKDLCQKLAPEINEKKANALWLSYLSEDNKKDKEELVNQLQLLAVKKLGVNFKDDLILLPPSSKKDVYGKGHIYLGDIYYGREDGKLRKKYPLYVTLNEINHHVLITGPTGCGKSTLAETIALQLLKLKIPFLVLENGSWRRILSLKDTYPEVENIQIFTFGKPDLAPFLWNWLANPPGISLESWIGIVTSTPIEASEISGAGSGTYLEDLALELIKKFERGELKMVPNTEMIKKMLEQDYNARGRKMLWRQTAERVLKSLTRESVWKNFNSTKPMDLKEILTKPTIIEISKEVPPKYRVLFKWLITLWITVYRFRQGESDKLRHLLLFEDFTEMLPQSRHEKDVGSNSIATLCTEIRKFGQGLLFSIQSISALSTTEIIANSKVQIHFSCNTKKDIEAVENALFLKPEQRYFLDLLDVGECIVKIKNRVKPCYVKFKELPILKGAITDKIIRERYDASR